MAGLGPFIVLFGQHGPDPAASEDSAASEGLLPPSLLKCHAKLRPGVNPTWVLGMIRHRGQDEADGVGRRVVAVGLIGVLIALNQINLSRELQVP